MLDENTMSQRLSQMRNKEIVLTNLKNSNFSISQFKQKLLESTQISQKTPLYADTYDNMINNEILDEQETNRDYQSKTKKRVVEQDDLELLSQKTEPKESKLQVSK